MSCSADPDLGRSRCVLIGNGTYAHLGIPDLPGALASVAGMHDLLTSELCGWRPGQITLLTDIQAPHELALKVRDAIRDAEDVLLCYYVGHGIRTADGQLALALTRTDPDPEVLPDTATLYDRLAQILRGSRAAVKIVILDCCHAELGNTANFLFQSADLAESYPVDGLYFIGASARAKKAKAPLDGGMTFFTEAFVNVVKSGIPNMPDRLRLDQIFRQVRHTLAVAGHPVPVESGIRGARQFLFARNAAPSAVQYDPAHELWMLKEQNTQAATEIQLLKARLAPTDSARSSLPPERLSRSLAQAAPAVSGELVQLICRNIAGERSWESTEELLRDNDLGAAQAQSLAARLRERLSAATSADPEQVRLILSEELISLLGPDLERGLRLTPAQSQNATFILVAGDSDSDRALVIEGLCRILSRTHKTAALVGVDARSATTHPLLLRNAQVGWQIVKVSGYPPGGAISVSKAGTSALAESGAVVVDFPTLMLGENAVARISRQASAIERLGHPHESLLVYDATKRLRGLENARALQEQIELTGVVLTRIDTSKPLIAAAVQNELSIPVKFLRLADRPAELLPFDPRHYARTLAGTVFH